MLFFCHCNDIPNNNYRMELIDGDLARALKPYFDLTDGSSELRLIPPPPPSHAHAASASAFATASLLYNVIETGVVYKFELQNPQEAFNGVDGLIDPTRGKYDAKPTGEWDRSWRITDGHPGATESARGRDRRAAGDRRDSRVAHARPPVLAA